MRHEALSNLREALELYFEDEPFSEGIRASDHRVRQRPGVSPALPASRAER